MASIVFWTPRSNASQRKRTLFQSSTLKYSLRELNNNNDQTMHIALSKQWRQFKTWCYAALKLEEEEGVGEGAKHVFFSSQFRSRRTRENYECQTEYFEQ